MGSLFQIIYRRFCLPFSMPSNIWSRIMGIERAAFFLSLRYTDSLVYSTSIVLNSSFSMIDCTYSPTHPTCRNIDPSSHARSRIRFSVPEILRTDDIWKNEKTVLNACHTEKIRRTTAGKRGKPNHKTIYIHRYWGLDILTYIRP